MGTWDGCWMGDYCMPEGTICPPTCNTPAPTQCGDKEVMCDNGMDLNGCWMGDYCMPEGSTCPMVCPQIMPSECAGTDMRYNKVR